MNGVILYVLWLSDNHIVCATVYFVLFFFSFSLVLPQFRGVIRVYNSFGFLAVRDILLPLCTRLRYT